MGEKRFAVIFLLAACLLGASVEAFANRNSLFTKVVNEVSNNTSYKIAGTGTIEVAFSPNEGAEALVLKVIHSAQREIRVMAYSFTSARIVEALIHARRRGVDVKVVVDYKANVSDDHSGKARAGLGALQNSGVDTRTIRAYAISHDKVIIVDGMHTELGSFNYSQAAATKNSENVLVLWNNPELASVYLRHFERNYRQSETFQNQY